MAVYGHSFNPDIYGDPEYGAGLAAAVSPDEKRELGRLRRGTKLPTDLCEALAAMKPRQWNRMCKEVFNCKPDFVDIETVLVKVIETDKWSPCGGDGNPGVSFWIDDDGWWTVDVYDHDDSRKEDD